MFETAMKKIFEFLFGIECRLAKWWVSAAHLHLYAVQWKIPPTPEWFDHSIDLYYQWGKTGNSLWVERGVFSGLALKGGDVLELACGDGFNAKNFYSHRSKSVIACDFDASAIKTAIRKNKGININYVMADIRTSMPEGVFQNIIWDAAIEHFTPSEIEGIVLNIKSRLSDDGVLSGYSIVEKMDGLKHLHQHEYEFTSKEDLKRFLTPSFKNVKVFETIYPSRHNLYFWASDSVLPFDAEWQSLC